MIVDAHTHIWSNLEQLGREIAAKLRTRPSDRALDAGPTAHERDMACVDGALVFGFRSQLLGAHIPNELVAEYISKDPQRRIGICGIDPMMDGALDKLEEAHALGLTGASLSPECQGFHPAHSSAMQVYEKCVDLGMPLFVVRIELLTSNAILEFGRPSHWDEVAQAFPKLQIVIGQLGYPWVDEALIMLGKHSNMYADIAGVVSRPWMLYNSLLTATSLGVMDRLFFGSGFPFQTPAKAIEALYSVNAYSQGTGLPKVPRTLLRGIVERDTLRCLGIDNELTGSRAISDASEIEVVEMLEQLGSPFGRTGHVN